MASNVTCSELVHVHTMFTKSDKMSYRLFQIRGAKCVGGPGTGDIHEHVSLTCKASRRSNMLIGGRGAGSMSAEQANK